MMKRMNITFWIVFFFLGLVQTGQTQTETSILSRAEEIQGKKPLQEQRDKKGFNPQVNLSLGSSFYSLAPGFYSFGTYVMPQLTLPVNKKMAFRAGMGYSVLFNSYRNEATSPTTRPKPQSYGTIYLEGIYRLTEKVTISAAGYKTFNLQPAPTKEKLNPHAFDLSNEGVMINMNYRVNDKFEINAGFSYDQRQYTPYSSPFFNSGIPYRTPGAMGSFNPF